MAPQDPEVAEAHTFLFADMVGFTAMTEVCGDEAAARAATDFYAAVRGMLRHHDAEEVKTIGDALMLRVPSPNAAVALAVRVIGDAGRRHGALAVRAGMHTGTAVNRDGDWFGATVNLAARVTAAAAPGEVLMTTSTARAAADALKAFSVRAGGRRRFKNVSESVEVLSLALADQHGAFGLPVDPVCGMAVDPDRSHERRDFRGAAYHFCSGECAVIFDRHPERYTR